MEAESICIQPVPFCMATLFSCRSYIITHHSAVMLLPEAMHTSMSTCRCTPCLHPLLTCPFLCAPALLLPTGLCSCVGITPQLCDSFVSGCLGPPHVMGATPHQPTHPHSMSCYHHQHPPCSSLNAYCLRGRMHMQPYGSATRQLLGRGREKNLWIQPREVGEGGKERERERMTDCNPP